ncbi:hypothetical protein BDD12DRAFT_875770 [Trichophaea hybrida]|nr:hypothetical protein BDD12DRAFT_875770 [Trichophaea hybrida]
MSQDQPKPEASGELVSVFEDGDMILDASAGYHSRRFKVSSHVLCAASNVFRAMFGPNGKFRESRELRTADASTELYVLPIEEDDLDVLQIILMILHHKNSGVPKEIDFEKLVQVAVLSDKYDLAVALRFTASAWRGRWRCKVNRTMSGSDSLADPGYENWLLVSWVFGEAEIFKRLSEILVRAAIINEYDMLDFEDDDLIVPDSVWCGVATKRDAIFDSIFKICKKRLEELEVGSEMGPLCLSYHPSRDLREMCDAFQLTLLKRRLSKAGLLPEDFGRARLMSINYLRDTFISMANQDGFLHSAHADCDASKILRDEVLNLINGIQGLELLDFPSRGASL